VSQSPSNSGGGLPVGTCAYRACSLSGIRSIYLAICRHEQCTAPSPPPPTSPTSGKPIRVVTNPLHPTSIK
jgi:hypothetical protein